MIDAAARNEKLKTLILRTITRQLLEDDKYTNYDGLLLALRKQNVVIEVVKTHSLLAGSKGTTIRRKGRKFLHKGHFRKKLRTKIPTWRECQSTERDLENGLIAMSILKGLSLS